MASQTSGEMNPRKVLLFSGHMIDGPNRKEPRFPADKEPIAAKAIGDLLDQIAVERGDLAICGGACGGDLLFAEAALARGLSIAIYLPFEEDRFLAESVDFADADWHSRYFAAKSQAALHIAPEELGPLKADENPFERNNVWMLQVAMGHGAEKVDFHLPVERSRRRRPGRDEHLMQEVQKNGRPDPLAGHTATVAMRQILASQRQPCFTNRWNGVMSTNFARIVPSDGSASHRCTRSDPAPGRDPDRSLFSPKASRPLSAYIGIVAGIQELAAAIFFERNDIPRERIRPPRNHVADLAVDRLAEHAAADQRGN